MKKIKTISQLRAEKRRVKQNQAALEAELSAKWQQLKECLKPVNIAEDTMYGILEKAGARLNNGGALKGILSTWVGILAGKLVDKAVKRFSKS